MNQQLRLSRTTGADALTDDGLKGVDICRRFAEEMKDYCEKLIDVVGKGTGFILSSGCTVSAEYKFESFKAMLDTARSHVPPGW